MRARPRQEMPTSERKVPLRELLGQPDLRIARGEPESRRQHSHDCACDTVEYHHLPEDRRVLPEPTLPCTMADDRHRVRTGDVLLGNERPAHRRLSTEKLEETRRHARGKHPLRGTAPGQRSRCRSVGGDINQSRCLFPEVQEIGRGQSHVETIRVHLTNP